MPVRAALTTYTYFLRSILTPPMPVRPVPRVCRAMSRGRVALFAGFASSTQARRELTPYRVQLPLGLLLRFRLFPTPPRGDAVAFRFTPGSRFGGGQIFTDWIVCSHDHTWPRHLAVVCAGGGGCAQGAAGPPLPLRTKRQDAASTPRPRASSAAALAEASRSATFGGGGRRQEAVGSDFSSRIPYPPKPLIPNPLRRRRRDAASTPRLRASSAAALAEASRSAAFGGDGRRQAAVGSDFSSRIPYPPKPLIPNPLRRRRRDAASTPRPRASSAAALAEASRSAAFGGADRRQEEQASAFGGVGRRQEAVGSDFSSRIPYPPKPLIPNPLRRRRRDAASTPRLRASSAAALAEASRSAAFGGDGRRQEAVGSDFSSRIPYPPKPLIPNPLRRRRQDAASKPRPRASSAAALAEASRSAAFGGDGRRQEAVGSDFSSRIPYPPKPLIPNPLRRRRQDAASKPRPRASSAAALAEASRSAAFGRGGRRHISQLPSPNSQLQSPNSSLSLARNPPAPLHPAGKRADSRAP
jgi:hypothetical protein